MSLITWIPQYILQVIARATKHMVTSEEYNELFNLTITQGDHNTDAIVNLREETALKLATATASATYATKAELASAISSLILGEFPANALQDAVDAAIVGMNLAQFKTGTATFALGSDTYVLSDVFFTADTQVTLGVVGTTIGEWTWVLAAGTCTITSTATETSDVEFDWGATK